MRTRGRQRARSGVTAGLVAALALAALPLIQQLFSVDRPKLRTKILIVLGSALLAFAADRLRAALAARRAHDDREARMKRALRAWPMPTLRAAEPHHLGVFPAARAFGGSKGTPDRYVRRQADGEIERAVAESFFVLIYGPRLVGRGLADSFELVILHQ